MFAQTLRVTLLAATSVFGLSSAANAAYPSHGHHHCQPQLPRFGMHSYNDGFGEVIVRVRHGGLACQLGLEEGDVIKRLNGYRLSYHGAWQDALAHAMADGGHIVLRVRDGRTGHLVSRHVDLDPYGNVIEGPVGPITPKVAVPRRPAPPIVTPKAVPYTVGYRGRVQPSFAPHVERHTQPRFSFRIGF